MKRFFRHLASPIAVAALAFTALSGCKSLPRNIFPVSGEVTGWQKTSDTRVFEPENLWQYLDVDSEQYIQAGVVTTSTSEYKFQNQLGAVVDIHTMSNDAGASRVLEFGRSGDARPVQVGDAGYAFTQSVAFRKGPYLVRIVAYQPSPDAAQALVALAHGVEARL